MELDLDEPLVKLRDAARAFGRKEAASLRERVGQLDAAFFGRAAAGGFAGLVLPAALGGLERGFLETEIVHEGLGEGAEDAGLALALAVHDLVCTSLVWKLGTERQKKELLPVLARGAKVAGCSLRELAGTSDPANTGLSAAPLGAGFVLDGVKPAVVNAPIADVLVVSAVNDAGDAPTLFLVPKHSQGVQVGHRVTTGFQSCPAADVRFVGCRVPPTAVLGAVGGTFEQAFPMMAALDQALLHAAWIGVMDALIARTLAFAREAQRFGRTLSRAQAVRTRVADMILRRENAAALVRRAAWELDRLADGRPANAAVAKLYLCDATRRIVDDAMTVHGWHALAPDAPIARIARDVVGLVTAGVHGDDLRSVVAGAVLDLG